MRRTRSAPPFLISKILIPNGSVFHWRRPITDHVWRNNRQGSSVAQSGRVNSAATRTEFTVALATHTPADALHLAVALDGAGWHPAAWREPDAKPDRLFTAAYWVGLAQEAERGLLDFVTIEDSLALQSDDYFGRDERTDRVRG